MSRLSHLLIALISLFGASFAHAQNYPNRPIRLIAEDAPIIREAIV